MKYNKDFWYLFPSIEYKNIKHADNYIVRGEKEKTQRKIYYNVEYTDFEKKAIETYKHELQAQKIDIPKSFDEAKLLKMVYTGQFDLKKSIPNFQSHLEWLNDASQFTITPESRALLEQGLIYLAGVDKDFRPILILNCVKLDIKKQGQQHIIQALQVFLTVITKTMFQKYHIENWVFMLETGEQGLTSLPIKAVGAVIKAMGVNYCGCMDRMYILNPGFSLRSMWSLVSIFIDKETQEKIQFIKKSEFKKLLSNIDSNMMQQAYGGSLQNVNQFWPIQNIFQPQQNILQYKEYVDKEFFGILPKKNEIKDNGENIYIENEELKSNYQCHKVRDFNINDIYNDHLPDDFKSEQQKKLFYQY